MHDGRLGICSHACEQPLAGWMAGVGSGRRRRGQGHTTCLQPLEQLLGGWITGGTANGGRRQRTTTAQAETTKGAARKGTAVRDDRDDQRAQDPHTAQDDTPRTKHPPRRTKHHGDARWTAGTTMTHSFLSPLPLCPLLPLLPLPLSLPSPLPLFPLLLYYLHDCVKYIVSKYNVMLKFSEDYYASCYDLICSHSGQMTNRLNLSIR
jgi:hypothetical protein